MRCNTEYRPNEQRFLCDLIMEIILAAVGRVFRIGYESVDWMWARRYNAFG
jgi:hypothetical protein